MKEWLSLFDVLAIAKITGIDKLVKRVDSSCLEDFNSFAKSIGIEHKGSFRESIVDFVASFSNDYGYVVLGDKNTITPSYETAIRFALRYNLAYVLERLTLSDFEILHLARAIGIDNQILKEAGCFTDDLGEREYFVYCYPPRMRGYYKSYSIALFMAVIDCLKNVNLGEKMIYRAVL